MVLESKVLDFNFDDGTISSIVERREEEKKGKTCHRIKYVIPGLSE